MSYSKYIRKVLEDISSTTTTTRYTPPRLMGDKDYMGDEEEFEDFPYVEDPTPYITYKAVEQKLVEQPAAVPRTPPAEPATEPAAADPAIGGGTPVEEPVEGEGEAAALGGIGAEAGMGLRGPGDRDYVKLDSSDLGRVYEMKKIYSRLTSVEAFLSESTDQQLLEVRRNVGKAIDLFEVVITNISQFKDKIDPIIVTFYEFLDQVYTALRKYHMGRANER
jgi:hypothetical protein